VNKNVVETIVFWGVTPCCLADRYLPFGRRSLSIFAVLQCSSTSLVPTRRLITERCMFDRPTQCHKNSRLFGVCRLCGRIICCLTQFTSTSSLAHL